MIQRGSTEQKLRLELTDMRRNPYLVNYEESQRSNNRRVTARQRQRRNARRSVQIRRQRTRVVGGTVCVAVLLVLSVLKLFGKSDTEGASASGQLSAFTVQAMQEEMIQGISAADYAAHPTWTEDFLTPNEYSRPGDALTEVQNIFVHYTANQGTSAAQNRSYFEQLKDTHERSASAHFIIGYEGEILQCVPLDEIAYAVQTRNGDSISIECCYLAADGSFTQETYDSLLALLRWLLDTYDLETEDILRHYDCGGKKCPIYYTEHEDAWERLKRDVGEL